MGRWVGGGKSKEAALNRYYYVLFYSLKGFFEKIYF
jgi:hypothetical protein